MKHFVPLLCVQGQGNEIILWSSSINISKISRAHFYVSINRYCQQRTPGYYFFWIEQNLLNYIVWVKEVFLFYPLSFDEKPIVTKPNSCPCHLQIKKEKYRRVFSSSILELNSSVQIHRIQFVSVRFVHPSTRRLRRTSSGWCTTSREKSSSSPSLPARRTWSSSWRRPSSNKPRKRPVQMVRSIGGIELATTDLLNVFITIICVWKYGK